MSSTPVDRRRPEPRDRLAVLLLSLLSVTAFAWSADPAQAAAPALRIVPAPASTGSPVTAFGQGWCASGCPAVQVSLGGNTVATATPRSDGSFAVKFTVRVAPGQYRATASQADPAGTRTASTGLVVLPADNRSTPPGTVAPRTPSGSPTTSKVGQPPATTPPVRSSPPKTSLAGSSPASTAPTGTSSPSDLAATTASAGGLSGWAWALIVLAVVGAAAAVTAWLMRRRARH